MRNSVKKQNKAMDEHKKVGPPMGNKNALKSDRKGFLNIRINLKIKALLKEKAKVKKKSQADLVEEGLLKILK